MSRVLLSLFLFGLAGAAVFGAAGFHVYREYALPGPLADRKTVVIDRGQSASEIAARLEDAGVIGDSRVFSVMAFATGMRSRLKAGEYEFPAEAPMRDVMAAIAAGKSISYKISIPEGWTSEMALAKIQENEILTGELLAPAAEGDILPDTYVFRRGTTRQQLLDHMKEAQDKLLQRLWQARSPVVALKTPEEAVVLASIVEKETAKPEERPVIASVFHNRLKKGMRLQSDPTIIYGIAGGKGKLDRPITREDIDTPTPYNTYTIDGLPPGPIANPGRAALEAVLNPPPTDYLYFVADGSGGHAFAATLEDHNRNVEKWRKIAAAAAAETQDPAAAGAEPQAALTTPLPDMAETSAPQADNGEAATAIPNPLPEGQKTEEPALAAGQEQAAAGDGAAGAVKPKLKPRLLTPGSVIEVQGTLVAIPKLKPGS